MCYGQKKNFSDLVSHASTEARRFALNTHPAKCEDTVYKRHPLYLRYRKLLREILSQQCNLSIRSHRPHQGRRCQTRQCFGTKDTSKAAPDRMGICYRAVHQVTNLESNSDRLLPYTNYEDNGLLRCDHIPVDNIPFTTRVILLFRCSRFRIFVPHLCQFPTLSTQG